MSRSLESSPDAELPFLAPPNRTVWSLIAIGALLRILCFPFSSNTGGDAWARLALTVEWLNHPTFKVIYDAYPPGHFWLIGLFTLVFRDVVLAGRLLSLVLGIGSLYFLWRLARDLYGETAGVFALATWAFCTLHIGYSAASSAEVPYLFFLIAGLAFFMEYFRKPARPLGLLIASGLSISAAESIRLEAWVIFFGLGVAFAVLEYKDQSAAPNWFRNWLKPVSVLAIAGGAWPIFSMVYTRIVYHDAMRVLSLHNTLVTGRFAVHPVPLSYQLAIFPAALLISLSPIGLAASVYGFWRSWNSRLGIAFASLVLFFALVQNYEIIVGKLLAMARYSFTLAAMLAVLAGLGFSQIADRFFPEKRRAFFLAVLVVLAINPAVVLLLSRHGGRYSQKFASVSPILRYSPAIEGVERFLRTKLTASDAVVIDDYNVESNVVAQAIGLPLLPGQRAYLANAKNSVTVQEYIAAEKPRFLVYADEGTLRNSLHLPASCGTATIDGVAYRCQFANQTYRIYELSYPTQQ